MDVAPTDARPIEGRHLTSWTVLPGGDRICLALSGVDGITHHLVLPFDVLSGLLMTLPRMLQSALDQRFPDGSFRVVQHLGRWQLEQQAAAPGLILQLGTTDGFEVVFALDAQNADSLGSALTGASRNIKTPTVRRPN